MKNCSSCKNRFNTLNKNNFVFSKFSKNRKFQNKTPFKMSYSIGSLEESSCGSNEDSVKSNSSTSPRESSPSILEEEEEEEEEEEDETCEEEEEDETCEEEDSISPRSSISCSTRQSFDEDVGGSNGEEVKQCHKPSESDVQCSSSEHSSSASTSSSDLLCLTYERSKSQSNGDSCPSRVAPSSTNQRYICFRNRTKPCPACENKGVQPSKKCKKKKTCPKKKKKCQTKCKKAKTCQKHDDTIEQTQESNCYCFSTELKRERPSIFGMEHLDRRVSRNWKERLMVYQHLDHFQD